MRACSDRPAVEKRPVAYVLKMFPRFSETFILDEVLELERQGVEVLLFSLKRPDDGIAHADVARVKGPVVYVPDPTVRGWRAYAAAHHEAFSWNRRRYLRRSAAAVGRALKKRSTAPYKHFLRAGFIAPMLARARVAHVHAHLRRAPPRSRSISTSSPTSRTASRRTQRTSTSGQSTTTHSHASCAAPASRSR